LAQSASNVLNRIANPRSSTRTQFSLDIETVHNLIKHLITTLQLYIPGIQECTIAISGIYAAVLDIDNVSNTISYQTTKQRLVKEDTQEKYLIIVKEIITPYTKLVASVLKHQNDVRVYAKTTHTAIIELCTTIKEMTSNDPILLQQYLDFTKTIANTAIDLMQSVKEYLWNPNSIPKGSVIGFAKQLRTAISVMIDKINYYAALLQCDDIIQIITNHELTLNINVKPHEGSISDSNTIILKLCKQLLLSLTSLISDVIAKNLPLTAHFTTINDTIAQIVTNTKTIVAISANNTAKHSITNTGKALLRACITFMHNAKNVIEAANNENLNTKLNESYIAATDKIKEHVTALQSNYS